MTEKQDIYQRVTDQIIKAMESGAGRWEMPWHKAKLTIPLNPTTGKEYRGSNIITLWAEGEDRGYDHAQWPTYRQWAEKEAQVRKGEKAALERTEPRTNVGHCSVHLHRLHYVELICLVIG